MLKTPKLRQLKDFNKNRIEKMSISPKHFFQKKNYWEINGHFLFICKRK